MSEAFADYTSNKTSTRIIEFRIFDLSNHIHEKVNLINIDRTIKLIITINIQ